MTHRQPWPLIVGIGGLLLTLVLIACGLLQSAAVVVSAEPVPVFGARTLPEEQRLLFAGVGLLCYAAPAFLVAGLSLSTWRIYGRPTPSPARGARFGSALLFVLGLTATIFACVMFGAVRTVGPILGEELAGRPAGMGEALFGLFACGSVAVLLLAASAAIWWFRVRKIV